MKIRTWKTAFFALLLGVMLWNGALTANAWGWRTEPGNLAVNGAVALGGFLNVTGDLVRPDTDHCFEKRVMYKEGYLPMDPYMACIWSDLPQNGIAVIIGDTYDDQDMINVYDQWGSLVITMDSEGRIYAKEFIQVAQ